MSALVDLRLVRVFAFYLATIFLIGVLLRIRQYWAIVNLVRLFQRRWPQLFQFITQQSHLFLTWGTVVPSLLTLLLLGIHLITSNYIWPTAELPLGELLHDPLLAGIVGVCTLPMLVIDVYLLTFSTEVDRPLLEKSFDQAEYWLRSWTGKVVRVISFGKINPQEMVRTEVRSSLQQVSKMLNVTLWWMSIQTGARIICGVALWGAYWLSNHGS